MSSPTHPVPSSSAPRIKLRDQAAYSIGGGVQMFTNAAPVYLANPIFNIALGLNPVAIGVVLAIGRVWDAITDPLVGHISDNTRSRWGRRRPYMFAGAILLGVSFAAMWWLPRGCGQSFYLGYFLFTLLSFYAGATLFIVPWNALGIELTGDYHERTRLFAGAGMMHKVAGVLAIWLYAIAQLAVFQDVIEGIRFVGCLFGSLLIIVCLLAPLLLKEPEAPQVLVHREQEPLWDAIKVVFSNWVLLKFSAACLITMMSLTTVSSLGLYINIYHVYQGDKLAAGTMFGIFGTLINVLGFVAIPGILWLSRRLGKHRAMMVALGVVAFSAVIKFWLYTPAAPFLQLATALLHAPGFAAYAILVGSMTADIADYDESLNGRRREALIAAANGWITKMGISVSYIFAGLVLNVTGFDAALGGAQTPETILGMRLLFCAIPAGGCGLALLLLHNYPLTKARMEAIQAARHLSR